MVGASFFTLYAYQSAAAQHCHKRTAQKEGELLAIARIRYNKGPVDKSKNSAGIHSGSGRIINLEIEKEGINHPLKV